jgi:DNA repair exonuclease SbcCD ATPase subunit
MVGIVTHVRELAERLPARLEVGRAGTTAAVRLV